jgi:hypothetical protein
MHIPAVPNFSELFYPRIFAAPKTRIEFVDTTFSIACEKFFFWSVTTVSLEMCGSRPEQKKFCFVITQIRSLKKSGTIPGLSCRCVRTCSNYRFTLVTACCSETAFFTICFSESQAFISAQSHPSRYRISQRCDLQCIFRLLERRVVTLW